MSDSDKVEVSSCMNMKALVDFFNRKRKDIPVSLVFLGVTLLLVGASIWAYHEFISSPPYVDPERYPVRGIDVSAHQGMMNLDAAARDGIEFIFIKASEGVSHKDENFRINYMKARHAGLKIGAYHYFRFDKDGIDQAINFLSTVGNRRLDLGLAIDVETQGNARGVSPDSIAMRLQDMIEYINLKGKRVTLYTNREGYEKYLLNTFAGLPLWICSFSSIPVDAEWTFWQFNHRGKVAGIRGNVDLDAFCGNRAEWENYLKGDLYPYSSRRTPGQR